MAYTNNDTNTKKAFRFNDDDLSIEETKRPTLESANGADTFNDLRKTTDELEEVTRELNDNKEIKKNSKVKEVATGIAKIVPTILSAMISIISTLISLITAIVKIPGQIIGKVGEKVNEKIDDKVENKFAKNVLKAPGEILKTLSELSSSVLNTANKFAQNVADIGLKPLHEVSLEKGQKFNKKLEEVRGTETNNKFNQSKIQTGITGFSASHDVKRDLKLKDAERHKSSQKFKKE